MPIHRIQGPDGKIHRIEAPADANPEALTSFLASQLEPKEEEEPGVFDKIQSFTTDIPVRAVKGALGGLEIVTDVFGADNPVSEFLAGAQEGINEYLVSDTAKQEAERRSERLEGKGFLGTLKEVPGILLDDPVLLFEALGSAAPSLGAAALTGGSSAAVQGAALLGTGAIMGAGATKSSIYDATKNELMRAGVSKEDAEAAADEAQSYTGENLDMIALGSALGAIASRTGMEPAAARMVAGRILGRSVSQSAGREAIESALTRAAEKGALRTAATEAVTEGGQGAQQAFAGNLALQRQGADVDLMEGVGSAAALEGTLGGILGGGFGAAGRRAEISRRLAEEEAASQAITGEGPRAPEEFSRDIVEQRLRTAAGEEIPAGQDRAFAVSKKLNEDIAFGTPDRLASTVTYLDDQQNQIDSGNVPEAEIEPLQRTIDEARTILNEFQQVATPKPPAVETPPVAPVKPTPTVETPTVAPVEPTTPVEAAPQPEMAPAPIPEVEPISEFDTLVREYVDRYMAGEGRGDTETDLQMQQFAANNPEAIEAEFTRRTQEAPSAERPDLGRSELDLSGTGGVAPEAAVAPAPEAIEPSGLGDVGTPAGQPDVRQGEIDRPLTEEAAPAKVPPLKAATPLPYTPTPEGVTAEARRAPVDMTLPELKSVRGVYELLKRGLSNRFADAPKVTQFFREVTGLDTVPEELNLGRAFELFQTKKSAAQNELRRRQDDILGQIKRERVSLPDVATFLMSRAAPAKNKLVAEVNAAFPAGGSGVDDAEAAANMADFKARGLLPKLERIAAKHDELVDFMGQERVRSGNLSQEEWQSMRAAQPFYTPFKGFALDGDMLTSDLQENPHAEERRQKLLSEKRGLGMREFFQAKGRNSLPFHPLYNLFTDAEALARRTAMNDVYNTFDRMVEANPEGMSGFVQGIYTDARPKKLKLVSKDNPAGREIDADMMQEALRDRSRYHVYKKNGVTHYLEFKDNEAGQAMQRLFTNMQPEQMGKVLETITDINNALKALLTYRNPIYLTVVAPLRDTLDAVATAMLNRNVKGSPAYKKSLARKVALYSAQPATWRTITRYVTGRPPLPGSEDLMTTLEQMLKDGGAPMGVAFRTAEDHASQAMKELQRFKAAQEGDIIALGQEGAAKVGRFLDRWAEINDLVPRLATYRAATEGPNPLSGPEAASLALDSSLNLTRRGEWSTVMDNLFPFFSAGVEGSRKVIRILKNPKTMTEVVGALMAIGVVESLINDGLGGDEDDDGTPDYLDVNRGKRMTHLVLYYGEGGDDYVTIPIGQMLGYFKYLGNKIGDTWLGVQSGEEAGAAILAAGADAGAGFLSLLSPARVQGGDIERTFVSLTPLWGKPIADLIINQNYFGTPIYQPEREDTGPAAELGRATTAEGWKSIARGLNEITGGSPATGGYVNFQPEGYRHIVQTYLGGWYRLAKQAIDFKEEPTGKNIPIVQGFLGKGFDYVPQTKYNKNVEVLEKIVSRIDKLSDAQLQREVERHPVALDPRVIGAYEDTERALQKLYKQRREDLRTEGLTESDKKALNEYYRIEMNKWQSSFNYVYDAVEEGR